jgi:hypothetical protein
MKPSQLTRRIEELKEQLKTVPSEGIRFDFYSFTEPEQLIILKNAELNQKYRDSWTQQIIIENKELIVKFNEIVITRVIELFESAMPKALMLDDLETWFFKFDLHYFWKNWIECQRNLKKWSKKDREDFLRDINLKPKPNKNKKLESVNYGEENYN